MVSLLLAVIYLAFISLGLPDALLGSAWPVMQGALNAPLSFAGAVSMVISGGTILSSLLSDRMIRKLGAGLVTALSVLMTAAALLGFSLCSAPWMLILWAVPYGLGAGAVDAALNNYVALHYSSRHMSWLHCMWGIGASISPFIMSLALQRGWGWQMGYRSVSYIQLALTVLLFLSLPLWKKRTNETAESNESVEPAKRQSIGQLLRLPGVPLILLTIFGYCAMESTAGLWASSYLVNARGVEAETAARFASLYFLGITLGRFLNGFIADRFGDKTMIRAGLGLAAVSILIILLPWQLCPLIGLVTLGIGSAPIYPCIIHSTPQSFGRENSQAIIGVQMASAYIGSTFMPPLFGLIAQYGNIGFYPVYLMIFAVLMIVLYGLFTKGQGKKA